MHDPPRNLVFLRYLSSGISYTQSGKARSSYGASTLTWVVHRINHDSSILPIPPVLMHQRSNLSRFRFPGYTTIALIISIISIIARLDMRMAGTRHVLDSPHVLSVG